MRKVLLLAVFLLAFAGLLPAQSADLPALMDREVPQALERHHAPGVVVIVVRDGQVTLARGYGFADVEHKLPVDPATTMFRAASVSKVFTATAVMQLVERKQLTLNHDINEYLRGFKIPPYDGTHLMLAYLLTHTAGFDDRSVGKSVRDPRAARPLGEFLAANRPQQFVSPGELYSYSNFGMATAGYAVECASGMDFARYQQQNIFLPLGMDHSSWNPQPGPGMAVGYRWNGRAYEALPLDYLQDSPAGQLATSGLDMARFLQATMGYEGADKLFRHRDTALDMQRVQFSHNAALQGGAGWGWLIGEYHGHRMVFHDGGYNGTRTRLAMFPEQRIGIYIASNALTDLPNDIFEKVANALLPRAFPAAVIPVPASYDRNVAHFAGVYRQTRYSRAGIEKVGVLAGALAAEIEIRSTADGMITMPKLDGTLRRMVQVEPGLFRSVDDDYIAAFRVQPDGRVTHLFTNSTTAFERTPWYLAKRFQRALMLTLVGAFVFTSFLATWAVRRLFSAPDATDSMERWRIAAILTATGNALYFLLWGVAVYAIIPPAELQMGFPYGVPMFVTVIQSLTIVSAGAALALVGYAIRALFAPASPWMRLRYGLLTLACVLWVGCMEYWNLLGWRY